EIHPLGKSVWRLRHQQQTHMRVLRTAELDALAAVRPRLVRLETKTVAQPRDKNQLYRVAGGSRTSESHQPIPVLTPLADPWECVSRSPSPAVAVARRRRGERHTVRAGGGSPSASTQ